MNQMNLVVMENLLSEIRQIKEDKRQGVFRSEKDIERSDEKIAKALSELEDNGALEQVVDELGARRNRGIRPDVSSTYPTRGQMFTSFGEQLRAIQRAAQTGEQPDSRLYKIRAATGMSESVPSDGGSNRGPLWE